MLTKKWKTKFQVSLQKPSIPGWRPAPPAPAMVDPVPHRPVLRRGYPVFSDAKNELGSKTISGQRKYRAPKAPTVQLKSEDFTLDNCHEMQGRFRFEVRGNFARQGILMEKAFFQAADDLYLAGWIKARGAVILGDLQGDVFALSYMQRWINERHFMEDKIQSTIDRVDGVTISHENYGVVDLPKRTLRCVKDWRKHYTKRDQFTAAKLNIQLDQLKSRSLPSSTDVDDSNHADTYIYQLQNF
jgi:hypothetical protein